MNLIHSEYIDIQKEVKAKIEIKVKANTRFSVTVDEHISVVVVVGYPTPSEGWEHGGRPWSPSSQETPKGLDQRRKETKSRQRVSGAKSS